MNVVTFVTTKVFGASCAGVSTAIISCESGSSGVGSVLKIILNILSVGMGILGAIGIVIFGIQYLTAGGNEQRVIKARRRLLEVIIGLALYAGMAVAVNFLLPESYQDALGSLDSTAVAAAQARAQQLANGATRTPRSSLTSSTSRRQSSTSPGTTTRRGAAAIAYYAEQNAWPMSDRTHNCLMTGGLACGVKDAAGNFLDTLTPSKTPNAAYKAALLQYITSGGGYSTPIARSVVEKDNNIWGQGASCDVFTGTAVREALGDMNYPFRGPGCLLVYMLNSADWQEVMSPSYRTMQPGDVMVNAPEARCTTGGHVEIFLGQEASGKPIIAQGAYKQHTGLINNYTGSLSIYRVFRYVGA